MLFQRLLLRSAVRFSEDLLRCDARPHRLCGDCLARIRNFGLMSRGHLRPEPDLDGAIPGEQRP